MALTLLLLLFMLAAVRVTGPYWIWDHPEKTPAKVWFWRKKTCWQASIEPKPPSPIAVNSQWSESECHKLYIGTPGSVWKHCCCSDIVNRAIRSHYMYSLLRVFTKHKNGVFFAKQKTFLQYTIWKFTLTGTPFRFSGLILGFWFFSVGYT